MKAYIILTCILVFILISGCATQAPILPVSRECTIKDYTNPAEILVEAAGIGRNTDESLLDARRSAVAGILLGGTEPLLQTQEEKAKFELIQVEIYSVPTINQFISWEAREIKNRVVIEGGKKVKITKEFKVNKKMLEEEMIRHGVKKPIPKEELGLPTIVVIPSVPKGADPLDVLSGDITLKYAATVIKSYLTNRRYDVQVPEQKVAVDGLTEAMKAIKGMEEDLIYQLALSIGGDIYITYTVDLQTRNLGGTTVRKAIVGVEAFETTTARLLGSETGYSQERPAEDLVVIEEALHGAIDNVLSRVNAYWKDDLVRGIQYKLVITIEGNFSEDDRENMAFSVSRAIKKNCKTSKENIATEQTLDYIVWVDPKVISSSRELYMSIKQDYSAKGQMRSICIVGKLISLKITE